MSFASEFKEFAMKGNVMDLAVGVIIGGAFGKIVDSAVNDLIMPIIAMIIGKTDFSGLTFTINDAVFRYGSFITEVIEPAQPASPQPLAPSGLVFAGVGWSNIANIGASSARGMQ